MENLIIVLENGKFLTLDFDDNNVSCESKEQAQRFSSGDLSIFVNYERESGEPHIFENEQRVLFSHVLDSKDNKISLDEF